MAVRSIAPPGRRRDPTRTAAADAPPGTTGAAAGAKRATHAGRVRSLPAVLAPLALGAVILAGWQFITTSGMVSNFLLPTPASVLRAFWLALTDGCAREGASCGPGPASAWTALTNSLFVRYSAVTFIESVAGCALGALVALPLGYAVARSRLIASAAQPYLAASQALPAVAIAPLIALWLGFNLPPVIALCGLIVFFPLAVTTTLGLRLLDRDILDAARVDGAGFWSLLWRVELPLALPSILAGLRTSLTLSVTGAVVGEFVVGNNGLGQLLLINREYADPAGEFATLLMLGLLATTLYSAVRIAERQLSYAEAS
jgi:NitT/TauT family transport system permease protein